MWNKSLNNFANAPIYIVTEIEKGRQSQGVRSGVKEISKLVTNGDMAAVVESRGHTQTSTSCYVDYRGKFLHFVSVGDLDQGQKSKSLTSRLPVQLGPFNSFVMILRASYLTSIIDLFYMVILALDL